MKLIIATAAGFFLCISLLYAYSPETDFNQPAPNFNTETWLNSKPLSLAQLKNKVVLVEFWTFGCYNCVNVQPYIKSWHKNYGSKGLQVIAVHSPEFNHEKNINNVIQYLKDNEISYPVAIDNDFAIWKRYSNRYWPAMYLIDKQGKLRYRRIGEGGYAKTEGLIQKLLAE